MTPLLGCAGAAEIPSLASAQLRDVLIWHVLPLLTVRELGVLACTCTALREWTYQMEWLWRQAAEQLLPPQHPPLSRPPMTHRAVVQRALQRRFAARKNILSGAAPSKISLMVIDDVLQLVFSRCATYLLIVTDRHYAVFSVEGGKADMAQRQL